MQYSMSRILGTRFYIWLIMTLYYKTRQILLQNASGFLLQNATIYYKIRQFYCKKRHLLQNAILITNCGSAMRNVATVSSDESTILILGTLEGSPTHFVVQCDQWFHDGLIFFFHSLLLLERKFGWALFSHRVRFRLLSLRKVT